MIARYTQRLMDSLAQTGQATERFYIVSAMDNEQRNKAEARARSRVVNAANRLGVRVSTAVKVDEHGPYIEGRVL